MDRCNDRKYSDLDRQSIEDGRADAMEDKARRKFKFSLWHEIIGHREMLVDWIIDQKNFNEGLQNHNHLQEQYFR